MLNRTQRHRSALTSALEIETRTETETEMTAVCRCEAPRLCTMRRVRQQVSVVAAAILVYNAPRFLEFRVEFVVETDLSTVCETARKMSSASRIGPIDIPRHTRKM